MIGVNPITFFTCVGGKNLIRVLGFEEFNELKYKEEAFR
jgi:hypothetical protein